MKRTWKDAACEVAWNRKEKYDACGVNISNFLTMGYGYIKGKAKYKSDIIADNFNDFRAAFMRWLDENERKK